MHFANQTPARVQCPLCSPPLVAYDCAKQPLARLSAAVAACIILHPAPQQPAACAKQLRTCKRRVARGRHHVHIKAFVRPAHNKTCSVQQWCGWVGRWVRACGGRMGASSWPPIHKAHVGVPSMSSNLPAHTTKHSLGQACLHPGMGSFIENGGGHARAAAPAPCTCPPGALVSPTASATVALVVSRSEISS